ncbi:MAG: nucleotide exchange factor GrpE [Alphaproteobacteria bacterium]|nr:nucleotide exchange factor GrpE [Alphaproteobacteria bacterium]
MKNDKKNQTEKEIKNEEISTEEISADFEKENKEEHLDIAQELEKLQEENAHLKNEFLRAYADAENTKKRCAQEIEKNSKYAISSFAKELLAVADNLHRAITSVSDSQKTECKNLLQGVEMTEAELTKVFNKFGIQKMDIIGTHFDPNYHQVIQEVEDKTKPAGTIVSELQTGYMINDRILREAMVVVSKGGK